MGPFRLVRLAVSNPDRDDRTLRWRRPTALGCAIATVVSAVLWAGIIGAVMWLWRQVQ